MVRTLAVVAAGATVLAVNAFTPGGGYVYIHRGLMNYLSTEAELFKVLKSQESFELQRAQEEGREPNIYHGVFWDHPARASANPPA
jgi:hypothetical protein